MEKTIAVLNGMIEAGVIENYAIGGAMAAVFYSEPIPTFDLDVFVSLPASKGPIISLRPIYKYLQGKGYAAEKEHIVVEGVPVQFIPAFNPLVSEAVEHASRKVYGAGKARVIGPEYLVAIMLQTGRPKDKLRIAQFLDGVRLDKARLEDVLARHGLAQKWRHLRAGRK